MQIGPRNPSCCPIPCVFPCRARAWDWQKRPETALHGSPKTSNGVSDVLKRCSSMNKEVGSCSQAPDNSTSGAAAALAPPQPSAAWAPPAPTPSRPQCTPCSLPPRHVRHPPGWEPGLGVAGGGGYTPTQHALKGGGEAGERGPGPCQTGPEETGRVMVRPKPQGFRRLWACSKPQPTPPPNPTASACGSCGFSGSGLERTAGLGVGGWHTVLKHTCGARRCLRPSEL